MTQSRRWQWIRDHKTRGDAYYLWPNQLRHHQPCPDLVWFEVNWVHIYTSNTPVSYCYQMEWVDTISIILLASSSLPVASSSCHHHSNVMKIKCEWFINFYPISPLILKRKNQKAILKIVPTGYDNIHKCMKYGDTLYMCEWRQTWSGFWRAEIECISHRGCGSVIILEKDWTFDLKMSSMSCWFVTGWMICKGEKSAESLIPSRVVNAYASIVYLFESRVWVVMVFVM